MTKDDFTVLYPLLYCGNIVYRCAVNGSLVDITKEKMREKYPQQLLDFYESKMDFSNEIPYDYDLLYENLGCFIIIILYYYIWLLYYLIHNWFVWKWNKCFFLKKKENQNLMVFIVMT